MAGTAEPEIVVRLRAENEDLRNKLAAAGQAIREFQASAQGAKAASGGLFASLADGFSRFSLALTGVNAGVALFNLGYEKTVGVVMGYSQQIEDATVAIGSLLKENRGLARQFMDDLKEIAAGTPFTLTTATASARQLLAYGWDAGQAIDMLKVVGDASAALNMGAEGQERIIRALGQMKAKGKVMGEEVRQLAEVGINANRYLQEYAGLTKEQASDVGNVSIDVGTAMAAIKRGMVEDFGGMSKKFGNTVSTLFMAIGDNTNAVLSSAFSPVYETLRQGLMEVRDLVTEAAQLLTGRLDFSAHQPMLEFIATLTAGVERALTLIGDLKAAFGTYGEDVDGNKAWTPSPETLALIDDVKGAFGAISALALDIGKALVRLGPTLAIIADTCADWLATLAAIADGALKLICRWLDDINAGLKGAVGGADELNESFISAGTAIRLAVNALLGFEAIKTAIKLALGLKAAFLAVKAAIKGAALTQMAYNLAANAVAHPAATAATVAGVAVAGTIAVRSGAWDAIKEKLGGAIDAITGADDFADDVDKKMAAIEGGTKVHQEYAKPADEGKPSGDDGKAAKARDRALREALKGQLAAIKEGYAKQLAAVKDGMAALELRYKQGAASWQEYAERSARAAEDEAALKEQEARDTLKATAAELAGEGKPAADIAAETGPLRDAWESAARELAKVRDGVKETAEAIGRYSAALTATLAGAGGGLYGGYEELIDKALAAADRMVAAGYTYGDNRANPSQVVCIQMATKPLNDVSGVFDLLGAESAKNWVPDTAAEARKRDALHAKGDGYTIKAGDIVLIGKDEGHAIFAGKGDTYYESSKPGAAVAHKAGLASRLEGTDYYTVVETRKLMAAAKVPSSPASLEPFIAETELGLKTKEIAEKAKRELEAMLKDAGELIGDMTSIPRKWKDEELDAKRAQLTAQLEGADDAQRARLNSALALVATLKAAADAGFDFEQGKVDLERSLRRLDDAVEGHVRRLAAGLGDLGDSLPASLTDDATRGMARLRAVRDKAEAAGNRKLADEAGKELADATDQLARQAESVQRGLEQGQQSQAQWRDIDSGMTTLTKREAERRATVATQSRIADVWSADAERWGKLRDDRAVELGLAGKPLAGDDDYERYAYAEDHAALMADLARATADANSELEQLKSTANQALEDGLVTFLTDGVNAANSLGEAFRNLVTGMLQTLQRFFAEKIVADFMGVFTGTSGGKAEAQAVAPTIVPGMSRGKTMAVGGLVHGPGTETSDSIPALLSRGEFVVRARAVRRYGTEVLRAINAGTFAAVRVPRRLAMGGLVGEAGRDVAAKFAATVNPSISSHTTVNNYVDGKGVFDAYGKSFVRSEVRRELIGNAKLAAEVARRL